MARIEAGSVRLVTRGGHDWTAKMRSLAAAIDALDLESGWLDGEIVVLNKTGVPDFNALQNAIDAGTESDIQYFVFDLPYFKGRDLRQVPLRERRALLRQLVEARPSAARPSESELRRAAGADARGRAPDAAGRDHAETSRRPLRVGAHRDLAQAEVQRAAGICHLRFHSACRVARRGRQPAARLLRRQDAEIRRKCRHGLEFQDRPGALQAPRKARSRSPALRCADHPTRALVTP